MAGIYLHIPFCRRACHYCDFHFSTNTQSIPEMVKAIEDEALLRKDYLDEPVNTIYFGGGTPSLLSEEQLIQILVTLRTHYSVSADAEITLEANPDDISLEKANAWWNAGINRLSIGIQSFFEADLVWMNRAHNAVQASQSIEWVQEAGFTNLTVDLIYGTPGLTDERWEQNVATAIAFEIPHLSCYALTVEPHTALAKMIDTHRSDDVDPEKQERHFSLLTGWLNDAGFEQYEISNFAQKGFRSRHNSAYWQGQAYLGLGPSAHSFNGSSRQWNISNNALYLKSIAAGVVPFERETLTDQQQLNEYIMTSLRTIEGISLQRVRDRWGDTAAENIVRLAQNHLREGYVGIQEDALLILPAGKFLADGIASGLFSV